MVTEILTDTHKLDEDEKESQEREREGEKVGMRAERSKGNGE